MENKKDLLSDLQKLLAGINYEDVHIDAELSNIWDDPLDASYFASKIEERYEICISNELVGKMLTHCTLDELADDLLTIIK